MSEPLSHVQDLHIAHTSAAGEAMPVLNGVELSVAPGEVVSVVGPSGSGKSTLLHAMAGFIRPQRGTVRLLGHDITRPSQRHIAKVHRAGVGFIFQSYNLIGSLPVLDNVLLPARFAGCRIDRETNARAIALLDQLGLGRQLNQRTSTLSGGQQQRAAVARVVVNAPRLVFADEPTGALDSTTGSLVLSTLTDLAARGTGVLLVTHDLQAAARADRAIVIRDGAIRRTLTKPTADALFAETLEVAHG